MKLGLNLSFAVKRWLNPNLLAKMCRDDFRVDCVQFTWDLIDPWWPEESRKQLAKEYKKAFSEHGIEISSSFGGVASYTYAQLLAPTKLQRDISVTFFKRAIDLTLELGSKVMGTPVGGMSYEDARDPQRKAFLYQEMLDHLKEIARYGKEKGLEMILIEATPLLTEFPHSPQVSKKMMQDLDGQTAIPIRLLIDWGHAVMKPVLKEEADMALWLRECAPYVACIHLQQTDGVWDRHWDFTKEGIITEALIKETAKQTGTEDIPQFLEVVTIFEDDDDAVYEGIKKTMDLLHPMFS